MHTDSNIGILFQTKYTLQILFFCILAYVMKNHIFHYVLLVGSTPFKSIKYKD